MSTFGSLEEEVSETFDRIDENGDRSISFEEFAALRLEMDHTRSHRALRREFAVIDRDRNGRVSPAEFRAWVSPQGR